MEMLPFFALAALVLAAVLALPSLAPAGRHWLAAALLLAMAPAALSWMNYSRATWDIQRAWLVVIALWLSGTWALGAGIALWRARRGAPPRRWRPVLASAAAFIVLAVALSLAIFETRAR